MLGGRVEFRRLVLLAAALSAALLPSAAGAADWTAPATVARYGYDPVAVGAPGDGQIVFAGGSPERLLTVPRSGSAFSSPRTFFASPPAPDAISYAFDGLGGGVLVYRAGTGPRARVMVQPRSPAGALASPRPLATAGSGAGYAVVAVARSGAAVVAWPSRSPRGWRVPAATRRPGHGFGVPQTIGRPSRLLRAPWVAVGDGGDALVVWHRQNSGDGHHGPDLARLWATFSVRGGRFGRSFVLGDGGDWTDLLLSTNAVARRAPIVRRRTLAVRPGRASGATVRSLSQQGRKGACSNRRVAALSDSAHRRTEPRCVGPTGADPRTLAEGLAVD